MTTAPLARRVGAFDARVRALTDLTADVERHIAALYGLVTCLAVVSFAFDRDQIDVIVACMELFAPKHANDSRVSWLLLLRSPLSVVKRASSSYRPGVADVSRVGQHRSASRRCIEQCRAHLLASRRSAHHAADARSLARRRRRRGASRRRRMPPLCALFADTDVDSAACNGMRARSRRRSLDNHRSLARRPGTVYWTRFEPRAL